MASGQARLAAGSVASTAAVVEAVVVAAIVATAAVAGTGEAVGVDAGKVATAVAVWLGVGRPGTGKEAGDGVALRIGPAVGMVVGIVASVVANRPGAGDCQRNQATGISKRSSRPIRWGGRKRLIMHQRGPIVRHKGTGRNQAATYRSRQT